MDSLEAAEDWGAFIDATDALNRNLRTLARASERTPPTPELLTAVRCAADLADRAAARCANLNQSV